MAKKKSADTTPMFTLSRKVEGLPKWAYDKLNKYFKGLTILQNHINGFVMRIYDEALESEEYKAIVAIESKKERQDKEKAFWRNFIFECERKKNCGDKKKGSMNALRIFNDEEAFSNIGTIFTKHYKKKFGINATVVQDVSSKVYQAWQKKLFENGKKIHFKSLRRNETLNTFLIGLNNKSFNGFDISNWKNGLLVFKNICSNKEMGKKPNDRRGLPLRFKLDDEYALFATQEELRQIGITRRWIRGKWQYYVLFAFNGTPYANGRTLGEKGNKVGIDLGVDSVAVYAGQDKMMLEELARGIGEIETKIKEYDRKMDRSRRINNPDRYDESGQYVRLKRGETYKWKHSNRYKRAKDKRKDLFRKRQDKIKIAHNMLANEILSLGDTFIIEDNNVSSWTRKPKGTRKDKNGRTLSNKRCGKSVANHAPSSLVAILTYKANYMGGQVVKVPAKSTACTQYDHTSQSFDEHVGNKRMVTLSDGTTHQRDLHSAFNLRHVNLKLIVGKKEKPPKSPKSYLNDQMREEYQRFSAAERDKIEEIRESYAKIPKTFGIKK